MLGSTWSSSSDVDIDEEKLPQFLIHKETNTTIHCFDNKLNNAIFIILSILNNNCMNESYYIV